MLNQTEDEVNQVLINDLDVRAFHTSIDEARSMGALALFGEKYGNEVRVVEVGDYSRELCGGTHVAHSGQLGLIKLLSESSIGSGVRRVEALVGIDAFRFLAKENILVSQLSEQLKTRREELPERVSSLVTRLREAERELQRVRSAQLLEVAGDLAARPKDVGGVALVAHRAPDGTDADSLRKLALDIRGRAVQGEHPALVMVVGVPRTGRWSWWPPMMRPGTASWPRVRWSAWPRGPSAVVAAANPTWPRGAVPPRRRRRRPHQRRVWGGSGCFEGRRLGLQVNVMVMVSRVSCAWSGPASP